MSTNVSLFVHVVKQSNNMLSKDHHDRQTISCGYSNSLTFVAIYGKRAECKQLHWFRGGTHQSYEYPIKIQHSLWCSLWIGHE